MRFFARAPPFAVVPSSRPSRSASVAPSVAHASARAYTTHGIVKSFGPERHVNIAHGRSRDMGARRCPSSLARWPS